MSIVILIGRKMISFNKWRWQPFGSLDVQSQEKYKKIQDFFCLFHVKPRPILIGLGLAWFTRYWFPADLLALQVERNYSRLLISL
ncbi:hypothetical protein L1987_78538 [Smallanthus sonchifolius]|uniref:Uncharacterized protein n=1 Tax=Smallanthus sonchifolius TaxID=185202 RepID=A0ACB8ZCS7_9ASTR|nr:hypothetical protein L1987_78538 [Smallanthus sonchifolius]